MYQQLLHNLFFCPWGLGYWVLGVGVPGLLPESKIDNLLTQINTIGLHSIHSRYTPADSLINANRGNI
ncbi:MAG: hypothetical protein RBR67_19555, partial [Desulfobacterium sp.]|nr:hypothetical protein [Desulfobacterium sp.]